MKIVKNILVKSFIVFGVALILSFTTSNKAAAVSEMTATTDLCGVSDTDVTKYLQRYGYTVYSLKAIEGACDREATTQNTFRTVVFVQEGIITGHEDIPE